MVGSHWGSPAAASAGRGSALSWPSPCISCTRTSHAAAAYVGGDVGGDVVVGGGGGGGGEAADAAAGVGAGAPCHAEAQGRSLTAPEVPGNTPGARCSSFAPLWHLGNNSLAPD